MTTIDYLKLYREEKRRTTSSSSNSNNSIIRQRDNVQESSIRTKIIEQENHSESISTCTDATIISCADGSTDNRVGTTGTSTTNNTANNRNYLNNTSSSYPLWRRTDHARIPLLTYPTTLTSTATNNVDNDDNDTQNNSISSFVQTDTIQYYCPKDTAGDGDSDGDGVLPQQFVNSLIDWLYQLPENNNTNSNNNNEQSANGKWNTLKHSKRRVALFDASKQSLNNNNNNNNSSLFPLPLQDIVNWLIDNTIFTKELQPNHILINEYTDPTYGIMPHTDGPAYYSKTATISIGGPVIFHFTKQQRQQSISTAISTTEGMNTNITSGSTSSNSVIKNDSFQIVLSGTPSSLIVFSNDTYDNYLHSINEITTTTTTGSSTNIYTGSNISQTDIGTTGSSTYYAPSDDDIQIEADTVHGPLKNELQVPITEYTTDQCLNAPANIPIHRHSSNTNSTNSRCNDDRFYRISLTFRTKK